MASETISKMKDGAGAVYPNQPQALLRLRLIGWRETGTQWMATVCAPAMGSLSFRFTLSIPSL